ncbi:MAG TPA: serine/threonine-protein kinase [Kofleriaceae bacterium]|nr:serine/threonine-protein kinase [Kofleriaceae bacterium]
MSRIATGGMGELFLAQLRAAGGFEKLVVIKRILPHLTDQREFVDMFVEEARTAARITHPNVCQIYELGQVDGRYYMALEYLEGVPLADVMVARKRAPQLADLRLVISLVAQAAEGLHHAHSLRGADGDSEQLVHRDVNPRNIFVTSAGVAKVLDFGIVKVRGALSQTSTGAVKGTYSYMSPEQLQGEPLDCTADIFSLGTIAWEAVVGRRLFKRGSDLLTWKAIVEETIPRPSQFRYDLPPELDEAIMRALARPREMRYQSARELALALERAIKPLGAPFTTLAISAEIEKAFTAELAQQRERVFAAHKRQEADRLAGEPIDDWGDDAPLDTRVADPDYGYLVDSIAGAKPVGPRRPPSEAPLHTPSEIHTLDEELPGVGLAQPVRRGASPPYARKKKAPLQQNDSFVGEVPPGFQGAAWPPEVTPLSHPSAASIARAPGHELRGRSPWPMVLALLVFGTGAAALAYVLKKDGMSTPAADTAAAPVEAGAGTPASTTPPPTMPVAPPAPAASTPPAASQPDRPSLDESAGQVASAIPGGAPAPKVDTKDADEKEDDQKDEPRAGKEEDRKDGAGDKDRKSSSSKREKEKQREKDREREKEKASTTTATARASSAPKGSGFLTINAEPYATVYVDGKKRGYTPVVRLALPAGEHSVKLVSSGGQPDRRMTVKVSAGQEVRKFVKW